MPYPSATATELVACHDCDLLTRIPQPLTRGVAKCPRCGATLLRGRSKSVDHALALVVSGFLLFALANLLPFLSLRSGGQTQETSLISGALAFWHDEDYLLGTLVLLTTFLFPLLDLLGTLHLLLGVHFGYQPWRGAAIYRFLRSAQPWGMMEIFMLGVLVAVVKLGEIATVIPGVALYSFAALILVTATLNFVIEPHSIWKHLEQTGARAG